MPKPFDLAVSVIGPFKSADILMCPIILGKQANGKHLFTFFTSILLNISLKLSSKNAGKDILTNKRNVYFSQ